MSHLALLLPLLLLARAPGGERSSDPAELPPVGLERVRRTFAAIDADGDRRLDPAECARAGIPDADRSAQDEDGDGGLAADEFVIYYRRLLAHAGRAAADDLVREAARIHASRRARRQELAPRVAS